jgi:hypothetical protein
VANYPSFAQLAGSEERFLDDLLFDRAVNGTAKVRAYYPARKRSFSLRHRLTNSERTTLLTFYDTNRLLNFTLTWSGDGQNYTCSFQGPPRFNYPGGVYVETEVPVAER